MLKERDLGDVVAFAEVFNEADGLAFIVDHVNERGPEIAGHRARLYRDAGLWGSVASQGISGPRVTPASVWLHRDRVSRFASAQSSIAGGLGTRPAAGWGGAA